MEAGLDDCGEAKYNGGASRGVDAYSRSECGNPVEDNNKAECIGGVKCGRSGGEDAR
jgi:hypothetical protein